MDGTADEATTRRSRLIGAKLRGLVREHLGRDVGEASIFAPGAALLDGDDAWVYLDGDATARLGTALAWMIRAGAADLHVVADHGAEVVARRAAQFDVPISVWTSDDTSLVSVTAAPTTASVPAPRHHEELRSMIADGGADPVVEHGVLAGEVRGLEVCRVVDDSVTGVTRLEVGVGAHDREAFQMLHGDVPTIESLKRVVESVAAHRDPDGPPHPLKALAGERLLRWRLEQHPELVDAALLAPAPPPVARTNLKDPVPCVASGIGASGERLVVVCSTGVDLDVVPYAADARLALSETGVGRERLVLAMPARDRIGLVDEIADRLGDSVSIVSIG